MRCLDWRILVRLRDGHGIFFLAVSGQIRMAANNGVGDGPPDPPMRPLWAIALVCAPRKGRDKGESDPDISPCLLCSR